MRYAVMTDSTCDLPQALTDQYHIDVLCFKIALDGCGYTERQDFTPEEFCNMLRNAKGIPTTAQVTQYEFEERFIHHAEQGVEELLYVSINGKGSSTCQSAMTAAEAFHREHPESRMKIHIVDSHAYSYAQGIPVLEACEKLEAGQSMDSVCEYLEDRYSRMEILLTVYSLDVIHRSGRISAGAAIAGSILGIHPIFTLNDGESRVVRKVRGDKAVLTQMIAVTRERKIPGAPYYIGVSDKEKYAEEYSNAFAQALGQKPAGVFVLGAAVQSNTGPDAVGIVFEGVKRER